MDLHSTPLRKTACLAALIGILGCFVVQGLTGKEDPDKTPADTSETSNLPLLKAEMLAESDSPKKAIRALDKILKNRQQINLWEEALTRKLRLLANSGDSSKAIREAKRAMRSHEFRNIRHELHWWLVILYAGPEENLRRAIREAKDLSRGPRDNKYVERASYTLGIMHRWDKRPRRAIRALDAYLRRYGEAGRFSKAARIYLAELEGGNE